MVLDINNFAEFIQAIGDETTGLVIIDFYADWCGPCKRISPKFAMYADKYPQIELYKLNVDGENVSEVVGVCNVSSLPTFCFFKNGKYQTNLVGANEDILNKLIITNL